MRVLNVLAALLVLICNLVVSFSHTLALFRAGGFREGLDVVAAVGVETTFIMGALNIVYSRLKGVSPGVPAMMGGLLGVALVSWSNVSAGWAYGITGILLGVAVPASLIVSEAILSRAVLQRAKVKTETPAPVETDAPVKVEIPAPVKIDAPIRLDSPADTMPPAKVDAPAPVKTEAPAKMESTAPADMTEEIERVIEVALHLQQEDEKGRLPGRRRLAEQAGCSEWAARQALSQLKKRIDSVKEVKWGEPVGSFQS